ncbi:SIS domain-containing protein [candidate division KSB1 bacterium]|nr:SIS domain-containing protein [candidate division KSB1 bacterium]
MEQNSNVHDVVKAFIEGRPAVVAVAVELVNRYPRLTEALPSILRAYLQLVQCFDSGHQLFICGNGGSFSDALHISGELMKSFNKKRKLQQNDKDELCKYKYGNEICDALEYGFPVTVLGLNPSLKTAVENDIPVVNIAYAQELFNLGKPGDVLIGISTSGNAKNVIYATITAKAKNIHTISLTGEHGGELATFADISIHVPSKVTHIVQEFHLPVYHALCEMVEAHYFHENK